jgi:alpha-N-arabinofuranosidase
MLLVAAACGTLGSYAHTAQTIEVRVTIKADQPGTKIDRHIYGQFAEHLGRGIYEGVWVGEDSSIPNTRGYRNDVVAALKNLHVPAVRWPGGCFADEYHWREGIGPRAQRPTKINTTWGGVEESNAVGTHEFLDFAELIGADAYVTGDVGSGSPQEMAEWVEYITSDTKSTIAELRRKNGRDKPWRLPYFGVGNENWGCGGNMRAEFYADQYRPNVDDYHWTEVLMSQALRSLDAISLHYYTFPGKWQDKGSATGFGEDKWASTLKNALRMDELVTKHSAVMDKYDPQKRVGLFVDEWGTWYDAEAGRNPAFLYQQNTLRDALVAALTLDVFHRHTDRVRMTNIAQMVNVLQAMILTDKEKMILTPTYHVYRMYAPFQDAAPLPVAVDSPGYQYADTALPAVDASAALDASGHIQIALVNLDPNKAASVTATITGRSIASAAGQLLTAAAMDGHNSFDKPNAVAPTAITGTVRGDRLTLVLPPKSVVVVAVN